MRVSTRYPIAIHALLVIACFPKEMKITSNVISESAGCNAVIIREIFGDLKKAGIIKVSAGRAGAAILAKKTEKISLWDIYVAVETDMTEDIFKFHSTANKKCPVGGTIKKILDKHFDNAVLALKKELSSVSLEILISELSDFVAKSKQV